jgi:hypothetical protein
MTLVTETTRPSRMSLHDFWTLIDTLDGHAHNVDALVQALSTSRPGRVLGFADTLARRLHALDRYDLFTQPVREPEQALSVPTIPLSDDGFLYARCASVAGGRARYEQVLSDPTAFAGTWDTDGEALLTAAPRAWQQLTGAEWEHEEPVSYETGTNPRGGWPDDTDELHKIEAERPLVTLESTSRLDTAHQTPAGRRFYRAFGSEMIKAAAKVQADAEALLRENGGWPAPVGYCVLWFVPADFWDLQLERHHGPLHWNQREDRPAQEQPRYITPTIIVDKDETLTWSTQQTEAGLRALAAYMLLAELTDLNSAHAAMPTLRSWLRDAGHLLPHLPRS